MELTSAPYTVQNHCPPRFSDHRFQKSFTVKYPRDLVWQFLNETKTFTSGQPFPFRVEFVSGENAPEFKTGVLCNHHGPFMNFAGVIGEMREPEYRDLQYFYGSHAITLRMIRPNRLEFWFEEEGKDTKITLRVDSYTRNGVGWLWTAFQVAFWSTFPLACRIGLRSFKREQEKGT